MSTWIEEVEARIERYASDQDMPQAEWEATSARIVMDAMRLLAVAKAAEGFLAFYDRVFDVDYDVGAPGYPKPHRCRVCLAEGSPYDPLTDIQHKPDCRFQALVVALRG